MKPLPILLLLCGCSQLPDTPIGNYPVGPVIKQPELQMLRCVYSDGTVLIIRGSREKDCPVIERKSVTEVIAV